jgi:hypothetical protein
MGGFLPNILIWFAGFPPTTNPLIDGQHGAAFAILLLMPQAGNRWGLGRWWRPPHACSTEAQLLALRATDGVR